MLKHATPAKGINATLARTPHHLQATVVRALPWVDQETALDLRLSTSMDSDDLSDVEVDASWDVDSHSEDLGPGLDTEEASSASLSSAEESDASWEGAGVGEGSGLGAASGASRSLAQEAEIPFRVHAPHGAPAAGSPKGLSAAAAGQQQLKAHGLEASSSAVGSVGAADRAAQLADSHPRGAHKQHVPASPASTSTRSAHPNSSVGSSSMCSSGCLPTFKSSSSPFPTSLHTGSAGTAAARHHLLSTRAAAGACWGPQDPAQRRGARLITHARGEQQAILLTKPELDAFAGSDGSPPDAEAASSGQGVEAAALPSGGSSDLPGADADARGPSQAAGAPASANGSGSSETFSEAPIRSWDEPAAGPMPPPGVDSEAGSMAQAEPGPGPMAPAELGDVVSALCAQEGSLDEASMDDALLCSVAWSGSSTSLDASSDEPQQDSAPDLALAAGGLLQFQAGGEAALLTALLCARAGACLQCCMLQGQTWPRCTRAATPQRLGGAGEDAVLLCAVASACL